MRPSSTFAFPDGAPRDVPRSSVFSPGFLALAATQFFVALNDNMFRWLVGPVCKELSQSRWAEMPAIVRQWTTPETLSRMAVPLALFCFTVPFLLFASTAGFLADRFSKRRVMVACKAAEIAIVALGIYAIVFGNMVLMFVSLFVLGAQAMMFVTSKLGAIPEIVRAEKISEANGLINMASMSAMILGMLAGNWLYDRTRPAGQSAWWMFAVALFGVAVCGLLTSVFIERLRPANPAMKFPWNPVGQTVRDFRLLAERRSLFLAALGAAYFWAIGALLNLNIDQFATNYLRLSQECVGWMLASLTLGIGAGAVLAGYISRGRVELGLVPFGGLGIAAASVALGLMPPGNAAHPFGAGFVASCTLLALLGVAAGLYDIPFEAFLQDRSPPNARGAVMAAYNFLAFTGMMAASGVCMLLSGPLGLSSTTIFLLSGAATAVVTLAVVWHLPFETTYLATRAIVRCLYRVRVEGVENVPEGGALLAANHVSWADGVLLGLACPRLPRMVAFAKYFENPWLGWFGRLGRIIPIGTSRKSMAESIRAAREALQQGELVGIFPEGNITRSGRIEAFRPGFLSIVKETGAPVVPVHLGGLWGSVFSYEGGRFFWKWPKRWRYPVVIRFGPPIAAPADAAEVQRAVEALSRNA